MQLLLVIKQLASCAVIVLIVIACSQKNTNKKITRTPETITSPVNNIVNSIASHPTVDQEIVGIGVPSKQYLRFTALSKQASDKELVSLANHTNGNVRAYSFWALAKRNYPELTSVLDSHLKDTTAISYFSGCIMHKYALNDFYISILTPNSIFKDCKKLSTKEINSYRAKIAG